MNTPDAPIDEEHEPPNDLLKLPELIEACSVSTGISDLAFYHDHYLYGKSKEDIDRGQQEESNDV